ncbi:MAG: benzoate-CoA ligase family protein [Alphaproteobacteria bacterium]|nr:benzoate-CoA ligase family protein [Alphaproteobacteria bacterium]
MTDNTVTIDDSVSPAKIEYASRFNVAVTFVDRHLDEGRADKIAIRTANETVSFGELADRVNRCGNLLKSLDIGAGERVLMIVKDCPEFFYLFWGAIKSGIIPVPVNTLLRAADYTFMIEDSGCAAVVYSPEYAAEVEPALKAAAHQPDHILLTDGADNCVRTWIADQPSALQVVPAKATDDCFWLYSSGSTGRPKGAVHSHRDMVVTSQHYGCEVLGVKEDDVCFSAAKLFFAYGLGNAMTFPLWVGSTAVLSDRRPDPAMTFEVIEQFRPTIYFGVPTLYAAQLQALESESPDLSPVRICVSAGEALPADVFRRWREKTGLVILDGIGSTEALHIFISNRPDDLKPGTSGRAVPGYDAEVRGEDGAPIPAGESGRLFIRGGSTAKYYWNNEERTTQTMVDGWLDTGDTYIEEDGYFIYCGRSDDMMKVGGIWCSPFEIEARLIEHPKVLEAAVVGRDDDEGLTKPEAFIILSDGVSTDTELETELMEHCKAGLARYKYPRWFNFVDALPKTATGKIQRFRLRTG